MYSLKILDIFIGNQCNLACDFCDTRSDIIRDSHNDPDIENIKQGILLAKEKFFIENYSLLGGEPLMYIDKVLAIVRFIRDFDKDTTIIIPTNGVGLDKNSDIVLKLIEEYKVLVIVCDHFSAFDNQNRSNKLYKSTKTIADKLDLPEIDANEFFYRVMNWKNTDPSWQRFIQERGTIDPSFTRSHLYLKDRWGIFIRPQDTFDQHYFINEDYKPKPFASGDSESSYRNGCCSPFCSFLLDKKLFKCAALGTLEKFLNFHKVLNDDDWKKYLSYEPLDLTNCDEGDIKFFSDTKYRSINECDMCPNRENKFTKTPETVFLKKKYVQITRVE